MNPKRQIFSRAGLWLLAPLFFAGCASTNMHAAHHGGGDPMKMSATDMTAMCDMHKEMMSGKTPEQRQEMMGRHMRAMGPQMQQHMHSMMQRCK